MLVSRDIVAGLGLASRELLATSIALFEDSTLKRRVSGLVSKLSTGNSDETQGAESDLSAVTSLQKTAASWLNGPLSDGHLRLVLWTKLRESFKLRAQTFGSFRAADSAADDLVAAAIFALRPGPIETAKKAIGLKSNVKAPATLDELARTTLSELIDNVFNVDGAETEEARAAVLKGVKRQVESLSPDLQSELLDAIGADDLNDEAIRKIIITGGSLGTLGVGVSMGGFSAYILTAQASAFIPLVSGPALVSFVAVLSNPITIILATVGVGAWAAGEADRKVQSAIALRIVSLLALTGINAGDEGLRRMASSFALLSDAPSMIGIESRVLTRYRENWSDIADIYSQANLLDPDTADLMERPLSSNRGSRGASVVNADTSSVRDMVAMTALTLGELVYNIHALDQSVLQAADFSRKADLADPVAFAAFANEIASLDMASHSGALHSLEGYVAEQVVASQLVSQGHLVEFPSMSNQAGWDLEVDGVKFQIKNTSDLSLLQHHFEQYDYPVIANAELASLLAGDAEQVPDWASQVHFVEGFSQDAIDDVTQQTLDAADGMLHPHVPHFAVTLSAIRQLSRYSDGEISGSQAIQEVLIDGSIRAGLAVAGNYAGVAIGLVVFGPAGALILGGALPILSRTQAKPFQKALETATRGEKYKAWHSLAEKALKSLIEELKANLQMKGEALKKRKASCPDGVLGDFLRWRIEDEIRYLRANYKRLIELSKQPSSAIEKTSSRLIEWLSTSTLHPAVYQSKLTAWSEVMCQRPSLQSNLEEASGRALGGLSGLWASITKPQS
jgi:hypothetical protein